MLFSKIITTVGLASKLASGATTATSTTDLERYYTTVEPSISEIRADAVDAKTNHITSNVTGKAFDRFVVIWLENIDFDKAYENEDMQYLLKDGIVLTNNWALSHPSQENYLGSVAGDYFALDDDRFVTMPKNVSTIADLLDSKNISWSEYQEHLPYTGYQGFNFSNQETFANDYVRKHNPLVLFDSITEDESRLANIKNLTEFYNDLDNEVLPQWMFITPNMTNDGHDTTIAVAAKWSRDFLTPLLNNTYFMEKTLILLTFDENETYSISNKIFGLLLGGAVDDSLKGTEDDTFYNHYSEISTIEDNWSLPHLGRLDVDANVYLVVANQTGWENKEVDTTGMYNNESYVGYFNDYHIDLPGVNCSYVNKAGQGILDSIADVWCKDVSTSSASNSTVSSNSSKNSTSSSSTTLVSTVSSSGATSVGVGALVLLFCLNLF